MPKQSLKVSMDGLRHNLARSYSELVDMFNYSYKNDWEIDKYELRDKLESLRQDIAVLHCVFIDSPDEEFHDLGHEIKNITEITFLTEDE